MEKRALGKSGLEVGVIGLGAMPLSIQGRPDEGDGIKVVHAALAAGMTLIDTADVYCLDDGDIGHNERLIAKALASYAGDTSQVVVATKGGLERPRGAWTTNGRPAHLRAACDKSLRALGRETIDLYQLHAPDDDVPFEESVGTLFDLQRAGKIRHVGLSNVTVPEIEVASRLGTVVSVQNRCNPFDTQSFANGVVAHCALHSIAFLPHSPVGGHQGHARLRTDAVLQAAAKRHEATAYEICLAFLLSTSKVMIAIPGASKVTSATSSARASTVALSDADLQELRGRFPSVSGGAKR